MIGVYVSSYTYMFSNCIHWKDQKWWQAIAMSILRPTFYIVKKEPVFPREMTDSELIVAYIWDKPRASCDAKKDKSNKRKDKGMWKRHSKWVKELSVEKLAHFEQINIYSMV